MGQKLDLADQERFRAELRRTGQVRNDMMALVAGQTASALVEALTAWRRPRPAAKDGAVGPVAQQDRAAVS